LLFRSNSKCRHLVFLPPKMKCLPRQTRRSASLFPFLCSGSLAHRQYPLANECVSSKLLLVGRDRRSNRAAGYSTSGQATTEKPPMGYRNLGRSGLRVSELSYGSWLTFGSQVDEKVAYECMKTAFAAGVNFLDNAEGYAMGKSEIVMGELLKHAIEQDKIVKRSDLIISTKIFWGGPGPNDRGLSRKHIIEGTLASLKRLQLSYVDLIFCHRPDLHTPIEETVRAMSYLVNSGLAFYWGTSEWSAAQIMRAHGIAREYNLVPPTMEQPEYNMLRRERFELEYAPLYRELGLGTTIWSPLAGGLLTGKYNKSIPSGSRAETWQNLRARVEQGKELLVAKALEPIAHNKLGCSLAQLAIAWCLKNPNVSTVIMGASRPEQIVENVGALAVVPKLTDELMNEIDAVLENKPVMPMDFRMR